MLDVIDREGISGFLQNYVNTDMLMKHSNSAEARMRGYDRKFGAYKESQVYERL